MQARTNKKRWHHASTLSMLTLCLLTAGCSTVSVRQHSTSQTISKQRGNIVTEHRLSNQTLSTLTSIGIDQVTCLSHLPTCQQHLSQNPLNISERQMLGLVAELHYAKAKLLYNSQSCAFELQRPPINSYYANSPLSEEEKLQQQKELQSCMRGYTQHLLTSIRYSYAYLFYNSLLDSDKSAQQVAQNNINYLSSDLDIQTKDIYNAASNDFIKQLYQLKQQPKLQNIKGIHWKTFDITDSTHNKNKSEKKQNTQPDLIEVMQMSLTEQQPDDVNSDTDKQAEQTTASTIAIYLPNESEYLQNNSFYSHKQPTDQQLSDTISDLYSAYELSFSGLNTVSKREGVGVSYVTLLRDRYTTSVKDLLNQNNPALSLSNTETSTQSRIHRTGNLLLTGMVIPEGNNLNTVLHGSQIDVQLYNPYHTSVIDILGKPYALGANFSASYGLWLSENQLSSIGYLNLLARQESLVLPQLFMLEPYDPNKRVIIMLHGLASSPATWVSVTNDILGDPTLRENYQVWQVFYPTNNPMLENRYQIQQLLQAAYQETDPTGKNPASKHSVLISHSMGAVIGRMMLSNDDLTPKLNQLSHDKKSQELNKLIRQNFSDQKIDNRFKLQRLPEVDRAVFISAPFQGTDYADRWFTRAMRRVVQLPIGFVKTITANLSNIATEGDLINNPLGALYLQSGASQLSDKSSFMQLTKDLQIANGVTYHSIIANKDTDIAQGLASLQEANPLNGVDNVDGAIDSTPLLKASTLNDSFATSQTQKPVTIIPADKTKIAPVLKVEGDLSQSVTDHLSDGIVPYSSSHLEGAASETIIHGGHSIQETPQAVLVLRKILREHLKAYPITDKNKKTKTESNKG